MDILIRKKIITSFIVFFLLAIFSFSLINTCLAQGTIMNTINSANLSAESCRDLDPESSTELKQYCGDYELNDFVQIFINVAKWILGIVGSLALLAFIFGGVIFIISAGNTERISKAKLIITGAVIGLVIVLTSYVIIQFVLTLMGHPDAAGGSWATTP